MYSVFFLICLLNPPIIRAANNVENHEVRKAQFMSAMRNANNLPLQPNQRKRKPNRRLVQSMLKKSIYVPPGKARPGNVRQLADYYYYQAPDDDYGYYAAAANDDGAAEEAADDDMYLNYGFDLSSYSLKYATCSSIATFSDDLAEDEDSNTVLKTDQYVVFRFCPSDTCSSSSANGCTGNYGEYMLPIADWLEYIAEYREEEFERYCDYCEVCDEDGNYYDAADDAEQGDGRRRVNENDDAYVEGEEQEDPYANGYCSACYNYNDVCNDEERYDYSGFFNCIAIDVNDDQVLYIGPHCASDKSAIILTLFDDEYCSNYVGDEYDIGTITGLDLTTETLMQYYHNDCIACKASELAFQDVQDDDKQEDNYDLTEVCENVYNAAAKCNIYMYSYTQQSYQSAEQASNERTVCNFIKSVVTGAYDEKGHIYFDANAYSSDNKYNQFTSNEYQVEVVTVGQIFGLVIFSSVVLLFLISACIMHSKIQRKNTDNGIAVVTNKNTGIGVIRDSSGDLSPKVVPRQNSGILACRSEATATSIGGDSITFMGTRGTMA